MINFILEYYLFFIIAILIMPSIAFCSNILQHTLNENKKSIKQKFEYVSLTTYFLFSVIGILFSFYLFSLCIDVLNEALKQELKFLVMFFFLMLLITIISFALLISGIYFFKHLFFEAFRNIYYMKENNIIIVIQNKKELTINLNDKNCHISVYTTNLRTFPGSIGKYSIETDGRKIEISKILNFTPELEEQFLNFPNKKIINKNLNWI